MSSVSVSVAVVEPYGFALTMSALRSFAPAESGAEPVLRLAVRIAGAPTIIEVKEGKHGLEASSAPRQDDDEVRRIAEWVLFSELDLKPFYQLTADDPRVSAITKELHGVKPMRPASLFEMAVIAITEQQISLTAAYHIRNRLVQGFSTPIDDLWVFPEPEVLAKASLDELRSCGLSRQKADYIQSLAQRIVAGELDLNALKEMDDDQARETIMGWRGFGRWSADYILVRGLARPDSVPIDDIGIRNVVGEHLGDGKRATAQEVAELLEPFRPFRGLLAFYLLVYHRLEPGLS
ncbi:MAG TPA: DNA-3-methyladenine glycosylase [Armatimonadota bacterium]|nr:DNA-3-methyladenine glycosylase [Armatimonadota bacterium]